MSAYAFKTVTVDSMETVKESLASGAITPGMLIEQNAATTYRAHATAGGDAQTNFAVEDDNQGKEISDAYVTATKVFFKTFQRGDKVFALLADGQSVSVNDMLTSNGDGYLKAYTAPAAASDGTIDTSETIYVKAIVARALEAVDLSRSSGYDPSDYRILVEIM